MSWTAGVRFPTGGKRFSLLSNFETGSEAHSSSYSVGTGAFSLGVKRSGLEADHLPPSTEVINGDAVLALPHTCSWRGV
jgi:hypothetical protein